MSTITKERAQEIFLGNGPEPTASEERELARIALTSLEAEPVTPSDVTGPLAHAYKELTPTFMRNHIGVFERYGIYPDGSAVAKAMRIALDGMSRRAAMLQGAEPVTQAYKLPDDWVACSERMPVDAEQVYLFTNGVVLKDAIYNADEQLFYWEYSADTCKAIDASHWMPMIMPAAPQQDVK